MKQKRLTDSEKIELCKLYKTEKFTFADLSEKFSVSRVAIGGLLKRRGYKAIPQTILQRKYPIDETYFNKINTEEKAYFLGFLYADGYNNTDRNSVSLGLKETDKDILVKLNNFLQPTKPLQYIKYRNIKSRGFENSQNQYRLVIANKHISQKLKELGCEKAKTFNIIFPNWLKKNLIRHFIRGYFDGDGYFGKQGICIIGTESFCKSLSNIFRKQLNINTYIRTRHPERKHNIRMLETNGRRQIKKFGDWIYKNSNIYLKRKYNKYLSLKVASRNIMKLGLDKANGESIPIGNFMTRRTPRL